MLINFHNVSLRQEDKIVLQNVDFHVDNNDFIYIVGKVGSGKSSFLKSLYGEVPIAEGEAEILGYNLQKLKMKHIPELRRHLGIVFQDFQLMHGHTVMQNLEFVLRATGWKKKNRIERVNEVLNLIGLTDKKNAFPHELSGGEQQRICIARAILNRPDIILADEPIGNLDIETSRYIMKLFISIREQGSAIIMVTHNLNLLSEFPGIVYRCENGIMKEVSAEYNTAIEVINNN